MKERRSKVKAGTTSQPKALTLAQTVEELAEVLRRQDLSELLVEEAGRKIDLKRGGAPVAMPAAALVGPVAAAPVAPVAPAPKAETSDGNVSYITSPFVGTFYRTPNPDSPPYVDVGDKVEKGQVLCIVEAMKLMNEIEADDRRHDRRRSSSRTASRSSTASRCSRSAGVAADVQEGPGREPRRDRAARDPRLPRARPRVGRGALDRRRRRAARQVRRRERVHRPAAVAAELPATSRRSSRPPRSPAPTRSIPATASCRRTPSSPRSASSAS